MTIVTQTLRACAVFCHMARSATPETIHFKPLLGILKEKSFLRIQGMEKEKFWGLKDLERE